MKNARLAAFEILHGIFTKDAYSNLALDSALDDVAAKDKAFVSRLVYGTVERKITLEYLLSPYLKGRTKPKVKTVLLCSVYQLYFMDNVPASAVINEAVKLAEQVGCVYYKGLINAVLRQVEAHRLDIEGIEDESVRYSCPSALIHMWQKHYGAERTKQILLAMNEKPPIFAVPNPLYVDADELCYELLDEGVLCEVSGDVVLVQSPLDVKRSRAYQNGLYHIEDKSSFDCAVALGAMAGDTVLDVCAAPGGKAFTIAERMDNQGKLYAYDLYEHRVKLIADGAARLGLTNVTAAVRDAAVPDDNTPLADSILCDVPCSGFGIIRRKPEIRYKSLDSVKALPALQLQILSASALYLKNGGTLVYSTCTLNKKENEKVVAAFLAAHADFMMIDEKTTFPSAEGGDGFYYAVLKKND